MDLIERQAAIDEITEYGSGDAIFMSVGELKRRIEHLPSVQPEPSSVRENDADHIWYKGKQFISLTRVNGMLMEHQKCTDTISRQAAIDRINKQREHLQPDIYPQDKIGDAAYRICAEFIERLPSVQPEIIHCRDCKHRKCFYETFKVCDEWGGRKIIKDDDFCSRSERRTDDGK